jgi:hypothetical protein
MNQQHLSAYLNLIQTLLSCPDGEEWNVLHQHEELVNAEFVQFMEQVSQQLASDGKLEAAKFLHYWVGQLNHILVQAKNSPHSDNDVQVYFNLIQALLDCSEGKEGEILAENKDLVDSHFVYLMRQVARQMARRGEKETAIYLSNLAAEISQTLTRPANIVKPKIDPNSQINHPLNDDYIRQYPELSELISHSNNNHTQNTPTSNVVVTASPHQETLKDKQVDEQLNTSVESLKVPTTSRPNSFQEKQNLEISPASRIDEKLDTITQSLNKLEQILVSRSQPANPLWYMDILECALASNWLLTSEEIEQLIGVKPKCEAGKDTFQRGCWIFTKVGKTGLQTAWKVSK